MFIFLDTETTGNGADDRLCQLAFKTTDGLLVNEIFNPGIPITVDAMSIHHITNEMVKNKPEFEYSEAYLMLKELISTNNNVIVAHNAIFDIDMLGREGIQSNRYICTLKLARAFDTKGIIPKYNLQYLRYFLNLNVKAKPHDALGDIRVLEALFKRLYSRARKQFGDGAIDEMISISKHPVLIKRIPFGKYKGIMFNDVPMEYLHWLRDTDIDGDLEYTVKYHLGEI